MTRKVVIVGIAGPSGSGKTTVCRSLKERYPDLFEHIEFDKYLKSPHNFPRKGEFVNWEHPDNLHYDYLEAHLLKLQKGEEVEFTTVQSGELVKLYPKRIILAEGFLLLRSESIRALCELKIYFDIDDDLIIERRKHRFQSDVLYQYDKEVVIPEYSKHGRPQKKLADYCLLGSRTKEEVLKEMEELLMLKYFRAK